MIVVTNPNQFDELLRICYCCLYKWLVEMNGEDIPIEQLKSWLKDVKRISHELRELPEAKEPTFYDKKIDDVLVHLQAARAGLVEIAHGIEHDKGS